MHSYLLAEREQLHPPIASGNLGPLDRIALRWGLTLIRWAARAEQRRIGRSTDPRRQERLRRQYQLDVELERLRRRADEARMLRPLI